MQNTCSKAGAITSKAKTSLLPVLVLFFNVCINQGLCLPTPACAEQSFWDFGNPYYAVNPATLNPPYPGNTGSIAQGDLLILMIGMKPATANGGSVATPTGWTPLASRTAEGGYGSTLGVDTGNTNLYTFYKVAEGTESAAGSLAVTTADYDVTWAVIWRYIKTLEAWDVAGSTGADTSAGNVSVLVDSSAIDIAYGDSIIGVMCVPTDNAGLSNVGFSLSAAAFGPVYQVYNPQVSSSGGNDVGSFIARTTVTSTAPVTGNPAITATAAIGTNAMGPGVFIRIRELNLPHTLTVNKAGTGSGSVTGGGIDCGDLCSHIYEYGTQLDLTAGADNCSFFSIWGDACNTTATMCHLAMTADRTVVARFEKYPLVWTTSKESGYATITEAYRNTAGGTIYLQAHNFTEDLLLSLPADVTFEAGYDCNCTNITGSASVRSLSITDGSATISNGIFVIGQ